MEIRRDHRERDIEILETLRQGGGQEALEGRDAITVVLGANADRLEPLVRHVSVNVVLNPDHAQGMAGSIRAGLAAAPADASVVCSERQMGKGLPPMPVLRTRAWTQK
jgi:hypothetical protein